MMENLIRENIRSLKPYSSARSEFKEAASIYLDANENGFELLPRVNRYPDPFQLKLKEAIGRVKGVSSSNIFLGNGSDEIIDLAFRIFCEPARDNVMICVPTYGMYEVCAQINNVSVKKVLLKADFQLNVDEILNNCDNATKLLFICSPNNPTGNVMNETDIEFLLSNFQGIVVIDEAYIDFSGSASFTGKIGKYKNLLVLQTLSKAWAMAGLRVGIGFACREILEWFEKVKPPYNINSNSQEAAISGLGDKRSFDNYLSRIGAQRQLLSEKLKGFDFVRHVYKSEANFLLIKVDEAATLYHFLIERGIVIRNRSKDELLDNCLRITIGTEAENFLLLQALEEFDKFRESGKS